MTDYSILAAKITADHAGQTAAQIAAALNAKNVQDYVPISSGDIKSYLIVTDKWLPIKHSALPECEITIDALTVFETFSVQLPHVRASLESRIDALVTGGFLVAQDKTTIMGMGETMRSWADIHWSGDVQIWQIKEVL